MEAIVSRMKTIQSSLSLSVHNSGDGMNSIRFIAVSATIPNISDVRPIVMLVQVPLLYV